MILLYNIRRQGWTLPVLAIGVWAFVALVVGVIYPAVLQALKVNPAQSTLEQPYIQRNINATRAAYGLQHVQSSTFQGNTTLAPGTVAANRTTLANIRVWDPDPSITLPTFQKLQDLKSYYTFQSVGIDRYSVGGKMTPAVVGVRQMNPADLPSSGWVNTHLEYTHGMGMALAEAHQSTPEGNPVFSIKDVPPVSTNGYPSVTEPGVYFGLTTPATWWPTAVSPSSTTRRATAPDVVSHYQGDGGVKMGNFFTRAAFAVRLGDLNLLISNLITPSPRSCSSATIVAMAQKAAPSSASTPIRTRHWSTGTSTGS